MILVALLTGGALDDAGVAQLAADLGVVPYEARMTVAAGYPALVATSSDAARAWDLVAKLRAHGHDATGCDGSDVVSSEAMAPLDRFTLDAGGLTAGGGRLEWSDVSCLLRATHKARSATETTTSERRFSAGRSLLSGGLSNTTTVTKQTRESAESREPVLYVFRRSAGRPFLLREQGTHYEGLGPALGRTTFENFATMVRLLRERAPHATYDERLVARARIPERSVRHGTTAQSTVTSSSSGGVDALAHLLAMAIARERGGNPHRR